MLEELENRDKKMRWSESLEENHPLLSFLLFQILCGIFMVAAVSGITFAGGAIIWMFYQMVGMM